MPKPHRADITIDGIGFYTIAAQTRKGSAFMGCVDGSSHGIAHCDNSGYTQDIADGAVAAGLSVIVNGKEYR